MWRRGERVTIQDKLPFLETADEVAAFADTLKTFGGDVSEDDWAAIARRKIEVSRRR